MPPPARGFGGTIGAGVETTWGTEVARTNWKEMVSMGIRRQITNKPVPELGRLGQVSSHHRFNYVESDFAGGPISYCAAYDDSTLLLLTHLLGTVATTGPVSTQYTHAITLASPPPTGLTLEQISGTSGGAGLTTMAEVFEGCKFASGKISITAGGLLMVESEVIAQTSSGLEAAGTPTYTTGGERIRHNHMSGLTLGAVAQAFNSLTIDIDRGLQRNHEVGSKFTSEPYEEQLEVTCELRAKWQIDDFDIAYLAGTQSDIVIPFLGTGDNALSITLHNCQVDDITREVNSKGAIEQVVKFHPYAESSTGDQGLLLQFKNANALSTAN